jgi:hypothetical protein
MTFVMDAFKAHNFVEAFRKSGQLGPPSGVGVNSLRRCVERIERRVVFEQQDGTLIEEPHTPSAENGGGLHHTYLTYRWRTGGAACAASENHEYVFWN